VDESFDPAIDTPAFPRGRGPVVLVDQAHRNVVSLATYLGPVGRMLEKDGYQLRAARAAFDAFLLRTVRVLVIANAMAAEGGAPDASAFTSGEISTVDTWVRRGGGLLLVADRAPFGGPARALARAFGVTLDDNTVLRRGDDGRPTGELVVESGRDGVPGHEILAGVARMFYVVGESVDGPGAILRAPMGTYSGPTAEATSGPLVDGRPLLLAFAHGEGRVVVLGDAGVVSAFGSAGGASHRGISQGDNTRLVRNIIRWLAR
jgi:hypothetical protein